VSFLRVIILAMVQGLAELLPISSSAHVVVAEKLMGLDPSSPEMTLLLVWLHTGTMLAVIVYFWKRWHRTFFQDSATLGHAAILLTLATAMTGIVGELLIIAIERVWLRNAPQPEVEQLFSHLELIAPALALAGALILLSSMRERRPSSTGDTGPGLTSRQAVLIGLVQGLCLPFRGFSRSGATISTGMLAGVDKARAEEFSFALAVILTPPVVLRETLRLIRAQQVNQGSLASTMVSSVLGGFCAFLAGLLALKWLSQWLEGGRWYLFGIYCLLAAGAVATLHYIGY
jgi:undecaprenyl-diphosphatase